MMHPSRLETRLRSEAAEFRPRCPDTPRRRVLRELRESSGYPSRHPAWFGWLAGAATAALALLVVAVLGLAPDPASDQHASAGEEMADSAIPPEPGVGWGSLSGAGLDRALAEREAVLEAELQRIQADLEKIRSLVTRAG